jgi:hypothetical protein
MDIQNFQSTYHGSPNDNITEFLEKYFGSSHGLDNGVGVYTTSDIDNAKVYANRQNTGGHLYEVQIPSDEYLWDKNKPFKEQSKFVKDRAIKWSYIPEQYRQTWIKDLLGLNNKYMEGLQQISSFSDFKNVEEALSNMGIKGFKYHNSYVNKKPILNQVIFNPNNAKIIRQLFALPLNELSLIPEYKPMVDVILGNKSIKDLYRQAGIEYDNGQFKI